MRHHVVGITVIITVIIIITLVAIRSALVFNIRRTIRYLLIDLINEFENEGVEYWVDFGSLLGIMREKDVILGDNDGDVCILHSNTENTKKVGHIVERMGGRYFDWGAFRVYNGRIFIDIFLVKEDNDEYKPIKKYVHPIVKKTIKLGGCSLVASLPNKPLDVLKERYGKDWRTPYYKWYFLYFKV